jgi:ATP-dependent DNA ligase
MFRPDGDHSFHVPAGERMQMHAHADGSVQMFSRRGREHCDWSSYDILLPVFDAQLAQRPCILDGELVVFNKIRCAALL